MSCVVVTGAASGIGRATAIMLGRAGASVGCLDLDEAGAEQTAADLPKGASARIDVRDELSCSTALDLIVARLGPITAAVNCAGFFEWRAADAITPAQLIETLNVNLVGSLNVARAVVARLTKSGNGGAIVLFSSGAARLGLGAPAYSASKAGVEALTRELAVAWAPFNVRVNAVSPGVIETPMSAATRSNPAILEAMLAHTPLRRLGLASEVAAVCAFLIGPGATYVTGAVIPVDGGFSVV